MIEVEASPKFLGGCKFPSEGEINLLTTSSTHKLENVTVDQRWLAGRAILK